MNKFNVGDYVRIKSKECCMATSGRGNNPQFMTKEIDPLEIDMSNYCGRIYPVNYYTNDGLVKLYGVEMVYQGYWGEDWLELVSKCERKFKLGDTVKIKDAECLKSTKRIKFWYPFFDDDKDSDRKIMSRYCGKTFTIEGYVMDGLVKLDIPKSRSWFWEEDWLELVEKTPSPEPELKIGDYVEVNDEGLRKLTWTGTSPYGNKIPISNCRVSHINPETGCVYQYSFDNVGGYSIGGWVDIDKIIR